MSTARTKRLLQFGLPVAGIVIALLCGRTCWGALGMLFLTAFTLVVFVAEPFAVVGMVFFPVLGLYGLKLGKGDPELDLNDPDTQLFMALGIPATLAIVGLYSFFFPA